MSPLSRDTLRVFLGTRRVILERRTGLFGRRVAARSGFPLAASPEASGVAVLDALDAALKDPLWNGANVRVTLSNALVRYVALPASTEVVGLGDEVALARLRLQQVHGGAVESLEVRLSSPLSGIGQLAAAVESDFLEGLKASLSAAKLRPVTIEPLFMGAFNRARQRLSGDDYWFACAEPGLLGLGRVRAGSWTAIGFSPFVGDLAVALGNRIREAVLLAAGEMPPPRVYVHAEDVTFEGATDRLGIECVNVSPAGGA